MTGRPPAGDPIRPLRGVGRRGLPRELLAGITLLALAIPLNIGYAEIAGLPPTAGLYAMVVPSILFALTVSSRQVVAAPDAAGSALIASSLGGMAVAGSRDYLALALAQALIGGVLFLLASFFRLGFLATFLSTPILVGFVGGIALTILVSQAGRMLGIPGGGGGGVVESLTRLIRGLGTGGPWPAVIALGALVVLIVGRRLARAVPWALVVLVLATVVVDLAGAGRIGVAVLGPVEAGPPTLTWPVIDASAWLAVTPSAIALTVVTMSEGLLVSRSYGERRGYRTRPDRDLLAFGLANLGAAATGAFTIGSSTSRTAAMDESGSRTQLPSLVAAAGALLLLVFGTGLLQGIPSPAIGAVVAVAVFPLLGIRAFAELWRQDRFEFGIAAACFLGAVLVGPVAGIVVAFVLAVVNVVRRAASPAIDILSSDGDPHASLLEAGPDDEQTAPGVIVVRLAAPLFFANGTAFESAVRRAVEASHPRHVVLDLEAVTDVDVTGAASWRRLAAAVRERGADLSVTRLRPGLRHRLDRFGLLDGVTEFATNRAAVAALSPGFRPEPPTPRAPTPEAPAPGAPRPGPRRPRS